MGGPVLMALGSGRELPPGLADGKTVVSVRGARPAQTLGYVVGEVQLSSTTPGCPPTAVICSGVLPLCE